jgi:hypothetical protein
MDTPNEIKQHAPSYLADAWKDYSIAELGQWVALLTKRAGHRRDAGKRAKDIADARNYLRMMESHIAALE